MFGQHPFLWWSADVAEAWFKGKKRSNKIKM